MSENSSQSNPSFHEKWIDEHQEQTYFKNLSIQDKIDHIVQKISLHTTETFSNYLLEQIFSELHLLFQDLENFKTAISDDQTKTLYIKYHSFIKQSNEDTMSFTLVNQSHTTQNFKNRIVEMMGNIKTLHNQALMSTKKHILWMDTKQSNNSLEFEQLQKDYKGEFIVRGYTSNKEFREDVLKLKDYPTVIILSAAAAGPNIKNNDEGNFKFLKKYQKNLRLRGVVIYCGQTGFDNLKGLFKDESKLLRCITTDYSEMMDAVKNLIIPLDFKRVIPIAELDAYLSASAINKLISFSQNNWSSRSLVELHPNKVNYKDIFKQAKDLISRKGIRMRSELVQKMDNISQELEILLQSTQLNNQELSKSLMRFYSGESSEIPVYNFLNSILNIVNEDLINVMQHFIDLFLIALYYYDDSSDSIIKMPVMNSVPIMYDFYRGTTIPDDQFNNDLIKINNIITLPGFSSFSVDKNIAARFIQLNEVFVDSQPVIFNYKYNPENQYFNNRPKFIDKVSVFKEREYLVFPFTCFCITEVIPPTDGKKYYDIVLKLYII